MDFTTEIEHDAQKYFVKVMTSSVGPEEENPKTIYVSVYVNKIVGEDKYPMDNIILKYNTRLREYLLISDKNIEDPFYKLILMRLDETYGDQWGFTAN